MSEFRFLYVGLRKTIKNIFKLGKKKKIGREKPGVQNCLTNRHPVNVVNCFRRGTSVKLRKE